MSKSVSKTSPAGPEEARTWFVEHYSACADLDTRLIPDLHAAGPGEMKRVECPIAFGTKDLDALRKRFSCEADILLTTAFGVTVSVWNADTKAFFPTGGGKRPVLVEWTPDQSLEELVRNRQEQAEGAARFGDYTYEDCVRDMAPGFSASFDGPDDPETAVGDDALAFRLAEAGKGGFKLECQFRSDQYSEGILQQFADSFSACLLSMEKADKVSDLAFATEKQVAETDSFNPEPFPGDPDVTLLDLFRENVAKYPDHPAVVFRDTTLTYAELDALTDRLAAHVASVVKPGGVVSIILNRNQFMVVAPLGVLKAGCAYEPLDPSYPTERLSFMVKDAGASLLIADPGLEGLISGYEGPILPTDKIQSLPEGKANVPAPAPDDLFILLYTSGTTGVPKGVQLCHRNISVFARNNDASLNITQDSHTAAYASFGFDANMSDFSTALAAGASLYIIPEEIRLDLLALNEYFEQNGITHSMMTTQVAT